MKKSLLFLFVIFLLNNSSMYASHASGAEITYRCLGNGQYEVTCNFYRDCWGIVAPTSLNLVISNSCGLPYSISQNIMLIAPPTLLTPVCPGDSTTCDGSTGNKPGIQKYIYRGTIILPAPCEEWIFSIFTSSRSTSPTTFVNPSTDDFFLSASINNSVSIDPCNTSPVFNNKPEIIACLGEPVCIDPGIFDADGDSVVCFMVAPLINQNTPLTYQPGYSISQPLSSSVLITLNSSNGSICFTPTEQEVTILTFLVKEFRNGILIGQVTREIILFIKPCSDNTPVLSGFLGTQAYTFSICAGMQTCFPIYSDDVDVDDTTTITWNQSITGASFFNSYGQNDAGLFCWQPDISDIRSTPYCFNATVTDNNCNGPRSRTYQYCIFVVDSDLTCLSLSAESNQREILSLNIFPQPVSDNFTIDFGIEFNSTSNYQLRIVNILGEVVHQYNVNEQRMTLYSFNKYSTGLHIAYLVDENGTIVKREKFSVMR